MAVGANQRAKASAHVLVADSVQRDAEIANFSTRSAVTSIGWRDAVHGA
jgi:hypothetical protein